MSVIHHLIDFILHLDKHLNNIIQDFGVWTYLILFVIVFCETGLVVTPFLPGDSLLFAVGAFAALGSLDLMTACLVLVAAGILGDSVNYMIGKYVGPKIFHKENARFLKREYLERTHRFYEKHGNKTIVLARFLPIIRTFAPFVAGIGSMNYTQFLTYNVLGAILWVALFVLGGYFFGNLPMVKENFTIVIFVIIAISVIPIIIEFFKHRQQRA